MANYYCPLCEIVLKAPHIRCHKCKWDAEVARKHNDGIIRKYEVAGKLQYHVTTKRTILIITEEMRLEMMPPWPKEDWDFEEGEE